MRRKILTNIRSIEDAMLEIDSLPLKGPYSHNIASIILRKVMVQHGKEAANKIVRDLKLTKLYNITEVA